jgi:hypothetical protein
MKDRIDDGVNRGSPIGNLFKAARDAGITSFEVWQAGPETSLVAQARIVVLMGELRHFPPGDIIVRSAHAVLVDTWRRRQGQARALSLCRQRVLLGVRDAVDPRVRDRARGRLGELRQPRDEGLERPVESDTGRRPARRAAGRACSKTATAP